MAIVKARGEETADALRRTFADNLRSRRVARKMNQVDLADLIGVSQGQISRYEKGERVPDLDELCALADALGTTPQALLRPAV